LFVVYLKNEAERISKLFNYDIVDRPESVKRFESAKLAIIKVGRIHKNKIFEISDDAKYINVNYKNGKLFKKYRVEELLV